MKTQQIELRGNILDVKLSKFGSIILHMKIPEIDGLYPIMISSKKKELFHSVERWKETVLRKKIIASCTVSFARAGDGKGNFKTLMYFHLNHGVAVIGRI